MKSTFLPGLLLFFFAGVTVISCKKNTNFYPIDSRSKPTDTTHQKSIDTTHQKSIDTTHQKPIDTTHLPLATFASCPNRPIVKVDLVPIGALSIGRSGMSAGTSGSKILFAGGFNNGGYSSRVDIYDFIRNNWTTAELSVTARQGMAVASLGTKIFFAGGLDADNGTPITSRVDIYDAATNVWSTAELSSPRAYLSAVALGNKVFFAGGANWNSPTGYFTGSDVVDIYDDNTASWAIAKLSAGRYELTATTVGNKIYFAGGIYNMYNISTDIDIYDAVSNAWTTSNLQQPRTGHVGLLAGNKILWAGGAMKSYQSGYTLYNNAEIRDASSGISSFECFTPKAFFSAVQKDDNIIFFPGWNNANGISNNLEDSQNTIDIYNISSNTWSEGILPVAMRLETVVSVNNEIYIAGGEINGSDTNTNQVWKLNF